MPKGTLSDVEAQMNQTEEIVAPKIFALTFLDDIAYLNVSTKLCRGGKVIT